MNTTSMRLRAAAAAASGARHVRTARNGQDAARAWVADCSLLGVGAVVVCDGCGSGESSEVGARLGAELMVASLSRRLGNVAMLPALEALGVTTVDPTNPVFWTEVRAEIVGALDALVREMSCPRERVVHDYVLFTTIAAVIVGETIVVWAIGDGAYAIDGRVRELGPFENNQPPYLAYDLVGNPQVAHLEVATGHSVIVATDGVAEIGLDHFAGLDRLVDHPDALRRQLATLARGNERIDWNARRVERTPALLQDDGAVAMLVRGAS